MKRIAGTIILTTVFALALAAPASAEQVDAAASSANCSRVTVKYKGFASNDKPVSEKVTVDGSVVYSRSAFTWIGSDYSHVIYYPKALSPGNHTVVFTATWATRGDANGTFTRQVSCVSTAKVNTSDSTADCAGVTVKYESFDPTELPVSEKITVDGTEIYNKTGFSWIGSITTHEISYPIALTPGSHTVVFTASWLTQLTNPSTFTVKVYCAPPAISYGCDGQIVDVDHPAAICPGEVVTLPVEVPGPSYGCDGEVVDENHPSAICPAEVVPVPVSMPAAEPRGDFICRTEGRLVLYTSHARILAQRLYVNGTMVAASRPNANSHVVKFGLPEADSYKLRIVAKLRSSRTGRKFRRSKTVRVERCGIAVARTLHVEV